MITPEEIDRHCHLFSIGLNPSMYGEPFKFQAMEENQLNLFDRNEDICPECGKTRDCNCYEMELFHEQQLAEENAYFKEEYG